MTPEEAIKIIHEKHMDIEFYFAEHDRYPKYYDFDFDQAALMAAQALKEVQQYRKIGTVKECQEAVEKQKTEYLNVESYAPAYCPRCGCGLSIYIGGGLYKYLNFLNRCPKCDQLITWDDN